MPQQGAGFCDYVKNIVPTVLIWTNMVSLPQMEQVNDAQKKCILVHPIFDFQFGDVLKLMSVIGNQYHPKTQGMRANQHIH